MKLLFIEDVPEVVTPKGEIGPFKRGETYKIPDDAAKPFLTNKQAIKLSDMSNNTAWELVEGSELGILTKNDENGQLELCKPFVYECFRCHEVIPKPSPDEPVICPNPNCSSQKTFILQSPERLKAFWKDGKIDPDWKIPQLPQRCEITDLYGEILDCLRKHLVLEREDEYHILATWILASWRKEDFHTCSYILFRGEINSGKTRGLELLAELSYRAAATVGTSPAYLYRVTEWFDTTVLIDEASGRMNRKYESGQWMYDFVVSGYRRGLFIGRCRRNDPNKTDRFDPFTFMALATRKSFDAAVNSRCIIIDMQQRAPEVEDIDFDWCEELRSKLLWFRLNESFDIPETTLKMRTREKFLPLMSVGKRVGEGERIESFAKEYERRMKLSDVDTLQASVTEIVMDSLHAGRERLTIGEIREAFEDRGVEISSSYLGRVTNDMGFDEFKGHSMEGTYIDLVKATEKIEYWISYYELGDDDDEGK